MSNQINIAFLLKGLVAMSAAMSFSLYAQEFDGAKILEMETKRAQELTELEHRMKVAEQQARLIEAEKKLRAAGVYLNYSDNGKDYTVEKTGAIAKPQVTGDGPKTVSVAPLLEDKTSFKVPQLKSVDGNSAVVWTKKFGSLAVTKGTQLPEGFKVVDINSVKGVTMERNGVTYVAQYAWD